MQIFVGIENPGVKKSGSFNSAVISDFPLYQCLISKINLIDLISPAVRENKFFWEIQRFLTVISGLSVTFPL